MSLKPFLFLDDRPGRQKPAEEQKRDRAAMLVKRLIVLLFALLTIGLAPLVLAGERDLFTDLAPLPAIVASN